MKTILTAGLVAGTLDIVEVCLYYAFFGIPPQRILQAIAGGLLGRDAFQGGNQTAALGLLLHLVIATTAAAVFYFASRKIAFLWEKPFISGALFGLAVYLFMNFVVLPLSAAGPARLSMPVIANGLFAHVFCVGLPISLITARARAV